MSKITVYGATGMVGSAIVREAVARGHSVVGVSRGGTPKTPVEGVRYVRGEIGDAADVVSKAQDCDIVVFAVLALTIVTLALTGYGDAWPVVAVLLAWVYAATR